MASTRKHKELAQTLLLDGQVSARVLDEIAVLYEFINEVPNSLGRVFWHLMFLNFKVSMRNTAPLQHLCEFLALASGSHCTRIPLNH